MALEAFVGEAVKLSPGSVTSPNLADRVRSSWGPERWPAGLLVSVAHHWATPCDREAAFCF